MIRNVDIDDISDGNLYNKDSLVKISCNDCDGCSKCCHDMGDSILLDPYDIYELHKVLNKPFTDLLNSELELGVVDGIIQPHIKMQSSNNSCIFLNEHKRCSIHGNRPGFCRLFPLGRIYNEDSFDYFNQIHECDYPNKSKIKIKKWLGIPELTKYENYINRWHTFTKGMRQILSTLSDDEKIRNINMLILNIFYIEPYNMDSSFYEQFDERLKKMEGYF